VAIGWQMAGAHRRGLLAVGAGLAVAAVLVRALMGVGVSAVSMRPGLPLLVLLFFYGISVVTFSELKPTDPSEMPRYPARMLALPVRTVSLVLWPLAWGVLGMVALWAASLVLVLWPLGLEWPFAWPALALAATVASFQAASWWPVGSPLLRMALASVLGPAPLLALGGASALGGWSPAALAALGAGMLGLGFCAAWWGVTLDRSGQGLALPDLGRLGAKLMPARRAPERFASAEAALDWAEWQRKGRVLLEILAAVLAVCVLLAGITRWLGRPPGPASVLLVAITPPWFATLLGPSLAKPRFWATRYGLGAFAATRPMRTGTMLEVLLRVGARSVAWMWVMVVVALPVLVWMAGLNESVVRWWEVAMAGRSGPEALLLLVALGVAVYAGSLGLLVSGLSLGLSGRMGLVAAAMGLRAVLLALAVLWGRAALDHLASQPAAYRALPWLLGVALAVKAAVAGTGLGIGIRRHVLEPRMAVLLAAGWTVGAASLALVLTCLLPGWISGPWRVSAALVGLILLPLAQPAFAPLAMAWDRHR
jgi:hypothetical protein